MKFGKRFLAIFMAGAVCLSLTACSGGKAMEADGWAAAETAPSTPMAPATPMMPAEPSINPGIYDGDYSANMKDTVAGGGASDGSSVYESSDVKLIRRASLTIQSTEFEQAFQQLQALVSSVNGYFESSEIYSGNYNNKQSPRNSYCVIRVPAERYDEFMNQASGVGHLTRKSESTEDVGEIYYDIEARLETQRTKHDRLMELLKKADKMEDIIQLQNALSDVEYQIEQYTSSLKRYDRLIGYATINLQLDEVYKIVDEPTEKESLFVRMAAGFASSFDDLVEGVQDFMIWISYNAFALVIWLVVIAAVAAVVCRKVKKIKLRRRKKELKTETEDKSE